jgi:spermidine/putrescine transport system permease protein
MRAIRSLSLFTRPLVWPRRLPPWAGGVLLLLPALLWYGFFFLTPLAHMITISFAENPAYGGPPILGFHLDSYQQLNNPLYINVFVVTLRMALIGTIACLLVGYPLAYFLATRGGSHKTTLLLLIIVPFWTRFLSRTSAWETILDPDGLVSHVLQGVGILRAPLSVLYTPVAIFIGILYNYLPLMLFPLYVALERLDKRLLEASKDLGAGRLVTYWRVTLPLTLPGVITGCLLVFIPLTGEYLIPAILGGSKNLFLGNLIGEQFLGLGGGTDWPFGSALSVTVIVLLLALVSVYLLVFRRVQTIPSQN